MLAQYARQRAIQAAVVLFAATVVVFLLLHLTPGDPAVIMLGDAASPQSIAELRTALGLDRPLPVQYLSYMGRLFRGDLGISIRAQRPVVDLIKEGAPATVMLTAAAATIALGVGIPVGILAVTRRGSVSEATAFGLSLFGQAIPGYWLALILINIFSVWLGWLPVSGSGSLGHLVLPAVTLAAFMIGLIVRLTRSTLLEVLSEDYIRTARAKGLAEIAVVGRHAVRNSMIPVITIVGLQIGTLLGGAVVTETVFGWPGIGRLAVIAIAQRDYPVVQGLVLISALVFVLLNFMVDLLYGYMDPRVRVR